MDVQDPGNLRGCLWTFERYYPTYPDPPVSQSFRVPTDHSPIERNAVPEAGRPLTVDAAACMLTLAKSYRNTCIRICRAAISQSPWAPHTGANRSADPAFATLCCKLVEEVYEALGRSEMARPAIQVLLPYFSDARFVSALKEAMDEEAWTPVDDHLAVFDLLLDAHEQRGAGVPACRDRTFAPHTRLLDELTRREDYHPIMKGGSFFFFGERIDYGPSLRSYREAAESVLQPNKRPRIEQWLVLLELVSFAIDHGRNK